MKNLVLLLLLSLFFLAGCGNTINETIVTEIQNKEVKFSDIFSDSENYWTSDVKITIWTGLILAEFWTQVDNEISRTASNEEKENGRKESIVSWYLYSYIYKDLWIKITTPPLYSPYFFEKTEKNIIRRYKNIIYNADQKYDYLAVFEKDPNISLEEEIIVKHLPEWCTIQTGILNNIHWLFSSMEWFYIVYIASEDWNLASNWEIFDKEFPENPLSISFVINLNKPKKYYKFSYSDCAPGPCSIFWTLTFEFLD